MGLKVKQILRAIGINVGIVGALIVLAYWNVAVAFIAAAIAGAIIETRRPSRTLAAFARGNVLFPPDDK